MLKGANGDELKKVKHVVQYGIFAAYHLALETSFLADEGASLPELPLNTPITVALPDKPSSLGRSISTFSGFSNPASGSPQLTNNVPRPNISDPMLFTSMEMAMPENSSEGCNSQVSASASVCPYGDMNGLPMEKQKQAEHEQKNIVNHASFCAREDEKNTDYVKSLEAKSARYNGQAIEENSWCTEREGRSMANDMHADTKQVIERHSGSSDMGIPHQENNQRDGHELSREEFSTSSDHQSILVSLSSRCIWKGTVCERAHLFRIKYYGSFDKPLGRFLRDNLFDEVSLFTLSSLAM